MELNDDNVPGMDRKYRTEKLQKASLHLYDPENGSYFGILLAILFVFQAYLWVIQALIQTLT